MRYDDIYKIATDRGSEDDIFSGLFFWGVQPVTSSLVSVFMCFLGVYVRGDWVRMFLGVFPHSLVRILFVKSTPCVLFTKRGWLDDDLFSARNDLG